MGGCSEIVVVVAAAAAAVVVAVVVDGDGDGVSENTEAIYKNSDLTIDN